MPSTIILVTAIIAFFGFLLNGLILFFVISRGKKTYHYLFGAVLLICAIWDLGIFLSMIRNSYENELIIYGYMVGIPCVFLPALVYQFTLNYLNLSKRKTSIIIWSICILCGIGIATGIFGKISGVIRYSWGNIYKYDLMLRYGSLGFFPLYFFALFSSCWYLWRAYKTESMQIARRHILYIFISFLALSVAMVKTVILYDVDLPFLLPVGMLLNDTFAALIGIAIIKHQLFDVTFVIQKGMIYSILAAVVIFVFSFSEHLIASFVGEKLGSHSNTIHMFSIAIVIIVLMPVKTRLEHNVELFFSKKKLEF
jgi:hypothetical protein